MKTFVTIVGALAIVALAALGFYMIDIDQTQETRLPDVDVSVEAGQLPAYDVDVGSIEIVDEERTIEVPNVEVTMEEETITVPTLNVTAPSDDS